VAQIILSGLHCVSEVHIVSLWFIFVVCNYISVVRNCIYVDHVVSMVHYNSLCGSYDFSGKQLYLSGLHNFYGSLQFSMWLV